MFRFNKNHIPKCIFFFICECTIATLRKYKYVFKKKKKKKVGFIHLKLMILARVRFGLRTIRRRRMDLVPCSKYHCLLLLVPLQKHPRHVLYPLQSVDRRRGHRCSTRTFHRHHQTQDSSS